MRSPPKLSSSSEICWTLSPFRVISKLRTVCQESLAVSNAANSGLRVPHGRGLPTNQISCGDEPHFHKRVEQQTKVWGKEIVDRAGGTSFAVVLEADNQRRALFGDKAHIVASSKKERLL
jgi:hypothetical protein